MSITAISFYWRNDTPNLVTWRNRLATAPDTPTCIVIHGGQITGAVHPPNQFVLEIVSSLPCSPALVRHTLLFVYFFKELFLSSAPLTNATPAFSTLSLVQRMIDMLNSCKLALLAEITDFYTTAAKEAGHYVVTRYVRRSASRHKLSRMIANHLKKSSWSNQFDFVCVS